MDLTAALAAWNHGEPAEALRRAILAWSSLRHPRVADLVDLMAREVPAPEPITGRTEAERREAWTALATRDDPGDLPALLGMLWPKPWRPATGMLRVLAGRAPDPRLVEALARLLVTRPYASRGGEGVYRQAADLLVALGDVRAVGWLDEGAGWHVERVRAALVAVVPAELEPRDLEALEALEGSLAPVAETAADAEALLAAVYANPRDLQLRLVYADHLAASGDPRGELVAAQIQGGRGAASRAKKLLAASGEAWVPGPILRLGQRPVFVNGFVERVDLLSVTDPARLGDPCWSTVRDVELLSRRGGENGAGWMEHAWVRDLESLWDAGPLLLRAAAGRVAWKHLGVSLGPLEVAELAGMSTVTTLLLANLDVRTDATELLLDAMGSLPRSVRELRLRVRYPRDDVITEDVLARVPAHVESVQLELGTGTLREPEGLVHLFTRRTPGGPFDALEVRWYRSFRMRGLLAAPTRSVRRLVVRLPDRELAAGERADLDRLVARCPRLDHGGPWPWALEDALPLRGPPVRLELSLHADPDVGGLEVFDPGPFGYAYDGLQVNGGTLRALKPGAVERWWAKPSTGVVALRSSGHRERSVTLVRVRKVISVVTDGLPEVLDEWLGVVESLFERFPGLVGCAEHERVDWEGRLLLGDLGLQVHTFGWSLLLGPVVARLTSLEAVRAALPAGCSARPVGRGLAILLGERPDALVDMATAREAGTRLRELLLAGFARERGYAFLDEVRGVLPTLEGRSWRRRRSDPFAVQLDRGTRHLGLRLEDPMHGPRLVVWGDRSGTDVRVEDVHALRAALEEVVSRA
ncbi:MAG: TIGR02996 domain-containing protein [Myxococcales bacterium]|nr:TIGR02996 domain-containing protein [Myxococcales bacterium]